MRISVELLEMREGPTRAGRQQKTISSDARHQSIGLFQVSTLLPGRRWAAASQHSRMIYYHSVSAGVDAVGLRTSCGYRETRQLPRRLP